MFQHDFFLLEALRMTGNLELKKNVFFDNSLVVNRGKISYAEVLHYQKYDIC